MTKEEIDQAYNDFELDYYKRQVGICDKLLQIHNNEEIPAIYRKWLIEAVNFIIGSRI